MAHFETKTEWAADQIRKAITSGRIRPGERLRIQEWATRLNVSATPLREALKALEAEGYLEIAPHRGAQVRPFSSNDFGVASQLTRALEGIAAECAVKTSGADERASLARKLARINESLETALRAGDVSAAERLNGRFHQQIYEAAKSPMLMRVREPMQMAFPVAWPMFWQLLVEDADLRGAVVAEHDSILHAIRTGETEAAGEAARAHIESTTRMIRTYLTAPGE